MVWEEEHVGEIGLIWKSNTNSFYTTCSWVLVLKQITKSRQKNFFQAAVLLMTPLCSFWAFILKINCSCVFFEKVVLLSNFKNNHKKPFTSSQILLLCLSLMTRSDRTTFVGGGGGQFLSEIFLHIFGHKNSSCNCSNGELMQPLSDLTQNKWHIFQFTWPRGHFGNPPSASWAFMDISWTPLLWPRGIWMPPDISIDSWFWKYNSWST